VSDKHLLSKTSFLKSVQCTKAFFLYKNHYQLKDPLPKEKQAVFNRGHQVGFLAQSLFPGGVDVSPTHISKFNDSVKRTKELIEQGCWIGAKSIVCQGVVVGSHAVLTVGSVATKNMNDYTIYQGNPAQAIKERVIS